MRVCEKEMLFTVCKFVIKYWIDFVQFLFLLCTLSFPKLICVPQSPQKVLLSVAAAVLRPSYLLHISYLHIPPPPSRDISTKRFPTTNLWFVNQPLIFLWVQKFLWFLQNVLSKTWLFKSKVNIRRSMLIRKGKLRKYHLQLVRRKVVLWSHSLSCSICWHYYKQMGSPHIFLLLWSNILQKESPEYPSYSLYLWSIATNVRILFTYSRNMNCPQMKMVLLVIALSLGSLSFSICCASYYFKYCTVYSDKYCNKHLF